MKNAKKIIDSLLTGTGITINGSNVYDPQVHNDKFYSRVLRGGSLALGESYMDGWWDCEKLDQFFHKVLKANLDERIKKNLDLMLRIAWNFVLNPGRESKAFEVGEKHYDIGNALYRQMLDKRLTYTCGYWKDVQDLDEAEEAKLDLVCRKIGLNTGQSILDIGSGWGSFIGYAAEKYDAHTVGYTISREQKELADEMYKKYSAETRLQDYRNINEKFDHVVSIGMFEHVGYKNHRTFMKVASKSLKDDGLFLLHTIAGNKSVKATDSWINKHIFPNSMLPSMTQIGKAIEGLFVIEDVHNFGPDYDKTLMAWFANFDKAWPGIKQNYSERFYRMWKYYLLSCAGSFRARRIQLWQIVLSKHGVANGYKSVR
ncbi:cyclopropane fatty acyl phospholipid synthase [bacterium]|nr:cyclopropane fatty acyl phospholipid synthase [bacterium]